ncbi:DUF3488 and DUF4129 domain-containing transglutaminase family protein [Streptomyces sp. NPDC057638]|uniref:transglutaminase TgpA family protein n=1 Tax=Streptomyces sp. NPDC057638 TaxID=3346190 RepID=UPI0036B64A27
MSGRARLTLSAYAATLLAASAMLPLLESAGWLAQAAILLGLMSGAGELARRVPLARPLTVLAQAVTILVLLTLVFAREQSLLGLVPGPETFQRFAELLRAGGDDIGQYAIPAPATDGIRLMVLAGVLFIGLLVDVTAVTLRSAAPAGLPLLALYSVAAGLSDGGASWLWFVLAASGYLLLLMAEGRDRLTQWGRVFGGPRTAMGGSGPRAGGSPVAPVRTGRRIGAVALGVALVVPAALPTLDGGLLSGLGDSGEGSGGGGTISAVNPLVSIQDNLNQPENREVLLYRTSAKDTKDHYLRLLALDAFDGTTWKPTERGVEDVPDRLPQPEGLSPSVATTEIETNLSAAEYYQQEWLPLPHPASEVSIDGRWRYEPVGRTLVGDKEQHTGGAEYTVKSLLVKPTAQQLAAAPPPPADLAREYTRLPEGLPESIGETARRITQGAANDHERAVRLQDWFTTTGGFRYDTQVNSGMGATAMARFLRAREGFCVHFASTMATMARYLGIPARVALGFTPGTPTANGAMSVGLRDAHTWPELYFEGVGWTRFEPTPSRGSAPDYTRAQTPVGAPTDPAAPSQAPTSQPSTAPTQTDDCPADLRRLGECVTPGAQNDVPDAGPDGSSVNIPLVTAGIVAALVIPLLPMVWRLRVRARRLGVRGHPAQDPAARTLDAWHELLDLAWDHGIAHDPSLTPRATAGRIVRLGALEGEAVHAVHRVANAVEQVLYAPRPLPEDGLAALTDAVRAARTGLRSGADRSTRLRALLLPRSSVRVLWRLSGRWSSLTTRCREWAHTRWTALRPARQRG